MSVAEILTQPVLAGTAPPPKKPPSFLKQVFSPAPNQFEVLPQIAYEQFVW